MVRPGMGPETKREALMIVFLIAREWQHRVFSATKPRNAAADCLSEKKGSPHVPKGTPILTRKSVIARVSVRDFGRMRCSRRARLWRGLFYRVAALCSPMRFTTFLIWASFGHCVCRPQIARRPADAAHDIRLWPDRNRVQPFQLYHADSGRLFT